MEVLAEVSGESNTRVVLEFSPPFYLCCVAHICPSVNSKSFIGGVISYMKCCRMAGPMLSDLVRIADIEFVALEDGKIKVTPYAGSDSEKIRKEIETVLERHRL